MTKKSIFSTLAGVLLMSSAVSAQPLVCALKVKTHGATQCEASIIGALGANMALQTNNKINVFSTVAMTDNEHLEQHIRFEEKGSLDLLSSSSLFTSIGSFTVLEAKGLDARLRCMPFTGTEETAKKLICQ